MVRTEYARAPEARPEWVEVARKLKGELAPGAVSGCGVLPFSLGLSRRTWQLTPRSLQHGEPGGERSCAQGVLPQGAHKGPGHVSHRLQLALPFRPQRLSLPLTVYEGESRQCNAQEQPQAQWQ